MRTRQQPLDQTPRRRVAERIDPVVGATLVLVVVLAATAVSAAHEGTSALAVSGVVTALAAAYGTHASLRFRRGLLAQADAERDRAELMTSRFHAAVDGAPVGVVVLGLDGGIELVNDRLRELMQVGATDELTVFDHFLPEDQAELAQNLAALTTGEVEHLVKDRQLVRRDGVRIWCRISSSMLHGPDGGPSGIVAHVQDIELERAAVEALRSRTRWFASIVERSSDLITLFDEMGVVSWVSPSVGELLGRRPDELLGSSVMSLIHREDRPRVGAAIQDVMAGRPTRAEYRVPNGNGEWVWLESTASNLLDDPDVRAVIALSRDVTERHRTTELLAHRAAHDPLTGLANRGELERRLADFLERAGASGESLAVAYLDLDGFKVVNDTHGHGAGDELLRATAAALLRQVRDDDVIARVGGDEFVVVLPGADLDRALATADRIRQGLAEPRSLVGVKPMVQVTVSIGLAVAQPGDRVASLLRDADAALYEAKRWGRDRIEVSRRAEGRAEAAELIGPSAGDERR